MKGSPGVGSSFTQLYPNGVMGRNRVFSAKTEAVLIIPDEDRAVIIPDDYSNRVMIVAADYDERVLIIPDSVEDRSTVVQ
jgi:hypothetical protein